MCWLCVECQPSLSQSIKQWMSETLKQSCQDQIYKKAIHSVCLAKKKRKKSEQTCFNYRELRYLQELGVQVLRIILLNHIKRFSQASWHFFSLCDYLPAQLNEILSSASNVFFPIVHCLIILFDMGRVMLFN